MMWFVIRCLFAVQKTSSTSVRPGLGWAFGGFHGSDFKIFFVFCDVQSVYEIEIIKLGELILLDIHFWNVTCRGLTVFREFAIKIY